MVQMEQLITSHLLRLDKVKRHEQQRNTENAMTKLAAAQAAAAAAAPAAEDAIDVPHAPPIDGEEETQVSFPSTPVLLPADALVGGAGGEVLGPGGEERGGAKALMECARDFSQTPRGTEGTVEERNGGQEGEEEEEEDVYFTVSESEVEVSQKIESLRRFQARTRAVGLAKLDQGMHSLLARAHETSRELAHKVAAFVSTDQASCGDAARGGGGGGGAERNPPLVVCTWINVDISYNVRHKEAAWLRFRFRGVDEVSSLVLFLCVVGCASLSLPLSLPLSLSLSTSLSAPPHPPPPPPPLSLSLRLSVSHSLSVAPKP